MSFPSSSLLLGTLMNYIALYFYIFIIYIIECNHLYMNQLKNILRFFLVLLGEIINLTLLPIFCRIVYSKMADEICNLLLLDINEGPTRDVQLSCFDTVFSAPIPQDIRSNHLQDAVSLFTCFLSEVAT